MRDHPVPGPADDHGAEARTPGEPAVPAVRGRGLARYEILQTIGDGASAVVYKARDRELRRLVAIKTIREGPVLLRPDEPAGPARLQHEAVVAARLSHPGIVAVYDVVLATDLPHVVMEYVEGCTLAEMLVTGPLPVEPAVRLVLDVCRALEYAHAQGVVHRDIKSSNILVGPGGSAKLADFGIAWIADPHATVTTGVIGTPSYMAPELLRGRGVDPRSDLFSLAVVLYEAVTGCKPFPGEDLATVLYGIAHDDPVPASRHNPDVSPALDAVIRRALSKEPEARYPDARALASALRETLAGPEASVSRGAPAAPVSAEPRRRPWAAAAAAVVLVAACTGLVAGIDRGWLGWTSPSPPRMPAAIPRARQGATATATPTRPVAAAAPRTPAAPARAVIPVSPPPGHGSGAFGRAGAAGPTASREPARDGQTARGGPATGEVARARESTPTGSLSDAASVSDGVMAVSPVVARSGEAAPASPAGGDMRPDAPHGCLSVNAIPFAAVYVDGRHVGDTPRACVRVRTGSHAVHFESPSGRSPERAIVVTTHHTADSPLAVSYDFPGRRFLGP